VRVRGYARVFGGSILVALAIGSFLSILLPALASIFSYYSPSWWASAWTRALNYLVLPGWIVWAVMLAAKRSMFVAVSVGVAVNALVYSALLYFPVLALKLFLFATRDSKS
jgi:hypothetical protein